MKNFFNKLMLVIGLSVPLGLQAQPHLVQDFLNVASVITGTNGLGITNLSLLITNVGMVHSTNVVYTNSAGNIARSAGASGGTNSLTTVQLFKTVSLWSDREGRAAPIYALPFISTVADNTNYMQSALTLFIRLASPLGSNAPVGINFTPLWDGETPSPATTHDWGVLVAGSSGGVVTVATNIPLWRWPGAKALAVRNITNLSIIAGEFGILSNSAITDLRVVGYRP